MHQNSRRTDCSNLDGDAFNIMTISCPDHSLPCSQPATNALKKKEDPKKFASPQQSELAMLIETTSWKALTSYRIPQAARMEDTSSSSSYDSFDIVKETQEVLALHDAERHRRSLNHPSKRICRLPPYERSVDCKVSPKFIDDFPSIEWTNDQVPSKPTVKLGSSFSDILAPSTVEKRNATLVRSKSFGSQLGSLDVLESPIG